MNDEDQHLANLYQRFPVNIARGKGAKLWDTSGNEYIDCMGGYGVAIVGHCNDRIVPSCQGPSRKTHSMPYVSIQ